MAWTTDDLVSEVRLKAWLPDADDLSAADLLRFGDDALRSLISALVKTGREEHWIETYTVTAAQRTRIPRRAHGRALRSVHSVSPEGDEFPFQIVPLVDAWMFGESNVTSMGYVEGDELVMLGTPPSGWSVRLRYLRRPSRLVPVSECRFASSVGTLDATISGDIPAAWVASAILDLVRGSEPHGPRADDLTIDSVSAPDITFTSSLPDDVETVPTGTAEAGVEPDYFCARDTTCLPPVPSALAPALVWLTVAGVHDAQKNLAQAQAARASAAEHMGAARAILEPRIASQTPAIVRRSGPLRGRRW